MRTCVLLIALWVWPATLFAQTGVWTATFPANPDHSTQSQGVNVVERYELLVTPKGGAAMGPHGMGKPAPVSGIIAVDVNAFIITLPPGEYTAVVRAVGPGGQAVSPASAPFSLVMPAPGTQGAPTISRSGTTPLTLEKK